MSVRIARLRARLEEQHLAALLVTKLEHIYYLSAFSGSSGALLITADRQLLISDFRYVLQIKQESPEWDFILAEQSLDQAVREVLADLPFDEIGFEADDLAFSRVQAIGKDAAYTLRPTTGILEALRLVKDTEELAAIREAVRITDAAYAHLIEIVRPGMTEYELTLEVEWCMRRHGAEAIAFPTIIAAGEHGALPHAQPGHRAVLPGDLVVIDMGARYAHYCADMTRTFAVGHATPVAREIYRICADAQRHGVEQIVAGMSGQSADLVVRNVIASAGYGDYFGHGTGHGVGLEVHEAPRLSRQTTNVLPAGATVTIEPGIYLPDIGGVRIEDLVIVRENGVEILTGAPKPLELPVIG